MKTMKVLHEEALRLSALFRNAERELIGVLQEIDRCRGYREQGYASLFRYAVDGLGLSDAVAFNLISIARKAREIPALKAKVQSGEISISNARMIAPVLTLDNQEQMLAQAATLPKRELERQIAHQFPERVVRESSRFVAPERIELRLGISPALEKKLKRAQDLVSQSKGQHVNLEETLSAVLEIYLRHKDPVEKAERVVNKTKLQSDAAKTVPGQEILRATRKPFPAATRHMVMLRDLGRCTAEDQQGARCPERRWLDFHHVIPRSRGGSDTAENLVLLCRAHHLGHHSSAS